MRRRIAAALLALLPAITVPAAAPVLAADGTPPVGQVKVVHDDRTAELVRLNVAATDDLSGVSTVEVSSNGTTWASFPYAAEVDWAVFDPAAGGSAGLGKRTVRVRWTDGSGNTSVPVTTTLIMLRAGALELPKPAVTGQVFTMRPVFPPNYVFEAEESCTWELRWGNTAALDVYPNETFGSITLVGSMGTTTFCGEWRVTLPWVPVPQFEIVFSSFAVYTEDLNGRSPRVVAATGSTDRRIHSSNFPMVQLLPDKYTVAVGERVTYTAYPIGTTIKSTDTWGLVGPGGVPYPPKYGGTTFSFVPTRTGTWLVVWNGHVNRPYGLGAAYDPRARKADNTAPNTTAPVERLAPGTTTPSVQVSLTWSGTDTGWGIASYQLQRSVDGGAWTGVGLPSAKTTSITQQLAPSQSVRYRVRAKDAAGNVGSWDYGPTFTPRLRDDTHAAVTFAGAWQPVPDGTAMLGALHTSSSSGASATFAFTGRDVGWVAARGPGRGQARVYVDGVLRATVNLTATSELPRQDVFRVHWATEDSHVLKVVVVGGTGELNVDGFVVLN